MINKVREYIKKHNLLIKSDSVIVGVSGGADSICLLHILWQISREMSLKLIVVHINHGIRGEHALGDYHFVQKYCNELGVAFHGFTFQVADLAKQQKLSIEEAGRKIRYETFEKVLRETGANKIAIAHNRNDNAETILLSLFRGSGIKGLTGIRPVRNTIIRPLLCLDRMEIEDYLAKNKINYRTDSTNFEQIYVRNRIRLDILPTITKSINSQAVSHIINAGEQLQEIEEYLENETLKQYNDIVEHKNESLQVNCNRFLALDIVIQKRIIRKAIDSLIGKLKDITRIHIEDVIELCEKEVGKMISLPYGLSARRTYDSLVLETKQHDNMCEKWSIKVSQEGVYPLPDKIGSIKIALLDYYDEMDNFIENRYTKLFDYGKIRGDLFLRTRLEGDYFTINSSNHKKKIKSFFIDSKIPKEQRDEIILLAQDNHILWTIGYRVSEYFRINDKTKKVLKVQFDGGHNAKEN